MPLSKLQTDILNLLASHRDQESFVAGSTPLNRNTTRQSGDIDIFHDREERVETAALKDAKALEDAGLKVSWLRRQPAIFAARIAKGDEVTRLEWVADSDYRFFPPLKDPLFGYVLNPIDLATNKAMAAAGRHEVRDLVDLLAMHENVLPLGAIVWAAVDKSPGFTPEGLIQEIRRKLVHSKEEWRSLDSSAPIDPMDTLARLRKALDEAEAFVARMPTEKAGLLFLENGRVVQPDTEQLDRYETHAALRGGHWPASSEIYSAMLEHHKRTE